MNTLKKQPSALHPRLPAIVAIVGVLSCLLAVLAAAGYFFLTPEDVAARPLVLIHAPLNGNQLEIGQTTTIHATARDENNITRLELWVDEVLVEIETTNVADGISPFPILVNWEPSSAGPHTLTIRAFNSRGARAHSSVTVEAIELPDRDGDGVADEIDACPDEASPTRDGCPLSDDRDNDGVPDSEDACPDDVGWIDHDGCPTPGDSDGDGVADEDDACPEESGLPEVEGCPDRDGDSIPDHEDADPDVPGPAESGGAPDSDGDTVPDDHDLAPEDPGPPGGGGAPESDAPDSDGDGARDDVDPCPDDFGEAEDGYCPPPDADPAPEDDGPIFEPPGGFFDDVELPVNLEIEAYEFNVSGDFDNVWCYVQVAEEDMQRYEFEPEGERTWNIRETLAGANSVRMVAIWGEPLPIFINCGADNIYLYEDDGGDGFGDGGGWGPVYNLGTHEVEHGSMEWDGRELIATGVGPDGESFLARYRICSPTCDETALAPPILDPPTFGPWGEGPYNIRWRWDGNEEWIDGFAMVVNGTFYDTTGVIEPDIRSLDISRFVPECGEVFEFKIFAFGLDPVDGTLRRSPYSNARIWDGDTCPRTVMVTFLSFDTGAGLGSRQGPISGTFFANDQSLIAEFRDGPPSFDATDHTERYLSPGNVYNIASLFSDIESEAHGCVGSGCTSNYAPSANYLEVEIGPREALTFGANIWKEGGGRAFEGSAYIPAGDIVPGEYVVYDNGINMTVLVDVLVGPEAGGPEHLPDLTITDITAHPDSGWLQIHLFNNASDLIGQSIDVNLVNMSTNESIGVITALSATIPSGRHYVMEHPVGVEPYDLRAIVDPDNEIDETNDGNNIFETPVSMHVEFTDLGWGSPCESFLDQEAEYRFRIWLGHRSPGGEVIWIAQRNHPWTGTADVDTSPGDDWEYAEEDWVLAGNPWFTFDFDIPSDHSLVIFADGYEDDPGLAADDYAGSVRVEFPREMNYGHSSDRYHYASTGWHDCPDGTPLGWDTNNFHIYFRINRIH